MKRYPMLQEVLSAAYERWRQERIDLDRWQPYQASQTKFATEVIGTDIASWSKWSAGSIRPNLDNLRLLAACSYIGKDVYPAIGIPLTVIDDPGFQDLARDWDELDEATREAILSIHRKTRQESPVQAPAVRQAAPA